MDIKVDRFIKEQSNLTLCTSVNDVPHCANCFYVYLSEEHVLVFKSSDKTKHILNAMSNNRIAGTIVPDIRAAGTIKGIQFSGHFSSAQGDLLAKAKHIYYGKNPMALLMKGELWTIKLTEVKMTDNTLGLGNRITWVSEDN